MPQVFVRKYVSMYLRNRVSVDIVVPLQEEAAKWPQWIKEMGNYVLM